MHSIRHMEVCSESSGCEQQREEIKVLCELYRTKMCLVKVGRWSSRAEYMQQFDRI